MEKVLFNTLSKYKEHISFHTPGHSGQIEVSGKYDITEISYSDNLLQATDVIKKMQENIAKVYGSESIFAMTSGASIAIDVAIKASKDFAPFLVLEPAHKSVFSSLRALGEKTFVLNRVDDFAFRESILYRDEVYDALDQAIYKTKAKTLIITSPNYFGNTLCVYKIKELKAKYNLNIILDAAHGSHFPFSSKLPQWEPIIYDYAIFSAHKTLPVLSGGAFLQVKNSNREIAYKVFQDVHSTSPLYLTLLSIEEAVSKFSSEGEKLYNKVFEDIERFKSLLSSEYIIFDSDDKTRIVIEAPCGEKAKKTLEENNIFIEMLYDDLLVLIITPYNSNHLEKVSKVLNNVKYQSKPYIERRFGTPLYKLFELKFNNDYELVKIEDAIGRISHKEFGIYPPGTPLVYPGQIITKEVIDKVKNNDCFGLIDGKCCVVKE